MMSESIVRDVPAAVSAAIAERNALVEELRPHMCERGAIENPLDCLRRIIRERDQAMGVAVIVPGGDRGAQ